MKIAFQSKSENPDLTLAERIGRFALAILEMIPIINYAVCALDKHLIFKEKISVIIPDVIEEKKLKEAEIVILQTNQVVVEIPVPQTNPFDRDTSIPENSDEEPSIYEHSEDDAMQIAEDPIISAAQPKQIHIEEQQIHIEEQNSDSDGVTPVSEIEIQNKLNKILESSEMEISEESVQEEVSSNLEYDESLENSEDELSFDQEVKYNPRFDFEPEDEAGGYLDSAWKITKAVGMLAFMFGTAYYFQKQLFGSSNPLPPTNSNVNYDNLNPTNLVPPPVKPHTYGDPIYIPPVFQTNQLEKPKICLLTAYTSDNSERREMSKKVADNQREYSLNKGYSYLEYTENLAVETDPLTGTTIKWEPYWSKIAAVNKILSDKEAVLEDKPEWIIWLDDDAVITNPDIKMEDIITHYTNGQKDLNFFVTTDSMSHILPNIPLNSAVLFIKNNDWSRKFFAKVWEMRKTEVPGQSYTYGNCPHQSCLHEQQAITDLLRVNDEFKKHAKIIPQRDPNYPVGINTFVRENHLDLNRNNMYLNYNQDQPSTKGKEGDFIQQCTGLATRAKKVDGQGNTEWSVRNLRLECINRLLKIPEPKTWSEFMFNT